MMTYRNDEIERYVLDNIPITAHMGVQLVSLDDREIRWKAPLQPNLNHRQTAFGGSIATMGIIASWTLVWLKLKDCGIEHRIVIQNSSTNYLSPIEQDFEVVGYWPDDRVWDRFQTTLMRRGRARIFLNADIMANGAIAGRHEGVYVALRQPVEIADESSGSLKGHR